MPFFEHSTQFDEAFLFSRLDESSPLSTVSPHSFQLEDAVWPTVEHYFQVKSVASLAMQQRLLQLPRGEDVHAKGRRWWVRKRPDFKSTRILLMTRALYSKARQNPSVADFLLGTGEQLLVETSMYDHFWGVGRDQRGQNHLGKIWMDVRQKLRDKQAQAKSDITE